MAVKEEKIEVEGEVVESLPSTMFRVQVDDGPAVLATPTICLIVVCVGIVKLTNLSDR